MENQNQPKGTPAAEPVSINKSVPKYGFCPLISTVQAITTKLNPPHAGIDVSVVKAFQQPEIVPVNLTTPCIGPNCQWFVEDFNGCAIRSVARLPELSQIAATLESQREPRPDELPVILNRIADICEKMGMLLQHLVKRKGK
jgi:hypothetical protein